MFKVINSRNVNRISKKNPIICYCSMPGACGPSGLTVVFFDDGTAYGYNERYLDSQKLVKNIVENVPELGACGLRDIYDNSAGAIKLKRASQLVNMKSVYLGLGNYAYMNKSLYSQYEEYIETTKEYRFSAFKKYIRSLGYMSIFSMRHIIEDIEKGEDSTKQNS